MAFSFFGRHQHVVPTAVMAGYPSANVSQVSPHGTDTADRVSTPFQIGDKGVRLHDMAEPKTPRARNARPATTNGSSLAGQLLVAMPTMRDKRFVRSVIYMCTHTADGAMGLIINQRAPHIDFPDLLEQLGIVPGRTDESIPPDVLDMDVHVGGPVDSKRGFVLHTADYMVDKTTMVVDQRICLTATVDVLKAIASGRGPRQAMLALGYAGWGAGQLDAEMQANGWLHCPADATLIFGRKLEAKYELAMSKIGIDMSHLVAEAGHA
jgi:putative transcriptional regulator